MDRQDAAYVLGHSDYELGRLRRQARLIGPITERFFRAAGIGPGMRVLDVGSGGGDVALLLAGVVGPSGTVVGVDISASAVEAAKARVDALEVDNVSFVCGSLTELEFEQPFDAAAGRYVLQFVRDPARLLRRARQLVRPGGVVVFHELEWDQFSPEPRSPTFEKLREWAMPALEAGGASTHMGGRLGRCFVDAGWPSPELRLEAPIAVGPAAEELIRLTSDLVITLLPSIERLGVATRAEIDPETLAQRISAEVAASGSVVVGRLQVGAWATVS
jgi:SAM-dependent methyltransferase